MYGNYVISFIYLFIFSIIYPFFYDALPLFKHVFFLVHVRPSLIFFVFVFMSSIALFIPDIGGGGGLAPLPFTLEFGIRFPVPAIERNKNVSTCKTQYFGEPP